MSNPNKSPPETAQANYPPHTDTQLLLAKLVEAIDRLAPRASSVADSATKADEEYRDIKAILRTHSEKP
ncbi:MAG: hypothetical protein ACOY0T_21195 [Myxococcota bacterium]